MNPISILSNFWGSLLFDTSLFLISKHPEEVVALEEFHDLTFQRRALHNLQLFPELLVIVFVFAVFPFTKRLATLNIMPVVSYRLPACSYVTRK